MDAWYPEIRNVHIAAVAASGTLFLFRALALNLAGAAWPRSRTVRFLAYTIDTVLLTAALMLMTIVRQYPFVDSWLTTKIVLLVAYVLLGWYAFRAGDRMRRIGFTLAAAAVYLFIVGIARAHHPLGILA